MFDGVRVDHVLHDLSGVEPELLEERVLALLSGELTLAPPPVPGVGPVG